MPEAVKFELGETQLTEEDLDLFHADAGKAHLPSIAAEQVYLHLPPQAGLRPRLRGPLLDLRSQ